MENKLLVGTNLSKSYQDNEGTLHVLRNANIEIYKGETLCITGQSGCGKSTLLHILGMLDTPDEGELYFNEKKIGSHDKDINKFRNSKLGFVFQFHYLLEDFTAEENVAMPCLIAGETHKVALKRARELMTKLHIADRAHSYPNQLSGGEQQRVAICRALINNPEIVMADEPTGNLDPKHSQEVIDLIMDLNRDTGQTFLIVTHNPEIAKITDRHLELVDGVLEER
ncbi:MAG: ABC transporter ATP-binding protein [Candidatus Zophobacter franzmannii]|nr:ABC transporter ATP-binding protein [Candidatus Zophobacter franzmannii]